MTLTVTVAPALNGTPTGTVTIFDNGIAIGTVTLVHGAGKFTSTTLSAGTNALSAVYSSDVNYAASSTSPSSVLTVTVLSLDFVVGTTTPAQTVNPGSAAAFTITVGPLPAGNFPSPVTLKVTGLPANFTASFAPLLVTPGSSTVASQLDIQTYATAASNTQDGKSATPYSVILACLLLPLLGVRRLQKKLPKGVLSLLLLGSSLGAIAGLSGCSGGYFGAKPASYELTVTGTNGSLHHFTTVTLNVQ
jgi:Bacterial Ig-like domain (group 3)